tara:strand:+ start:3118 stop:3489 length:372 start_codon:yes stop_codon:yes gene_type:complete
MDTNFNTPPSTPSGSLYRTPIKSSNSSYIPPGAPKKKRPPPRVSQEDKDILEAIENIKDSLDAKVPIEIRKHIIQFLETDLMRLAKKSRKINSELKESSYGGKKTRRKTNNKRKTQKLRYKKK